MSVSTGPRTPEQVLAAADQLEREMLEIANHERKPGKLSMEPLAVLIQHARDTKGIK